VSLAHMQVRTLMCRWLFVGPSSRVVVCWAEAHPME
jgi:hypothetical protein